MAQPHVKFNFSQWRLSMGYTIVQAYEALGCSRSHYWKMERSGEGPVVYAWACYGMHAHKISATRESGV